LEIRVGEPELGGQRVARVGQGMLATIGGQPEQGQHQ
jgi:hypothetical protein